MKRIYESVLQEHFDRHGQMALVPGPRQCGKTTLAKAMCDQAGESLYLNWDYPSDRALILSGPEHVIAAASTDHYTGDKPTFVALDEIHKLKKWKNYLKGYYDHSKGALKTLVTGSARLDIFKNAGDSLMGRYFLYHAHPLSVAELLERPYAPQELFEPGKLCDDAWQALCGFGGFPEPYFKAEKRFLNRWSKLRFQQLFEEDIQDLTNVSDIAKMEVLAGILSKQSGAQINYANLSKLVQVSAKTVKNWVNALKAFYYCFTITPWSKNVNRSLIKEPKVYLWDWSTITNVGARYETMMALHLQKAVHFWEDIGLGTYSLHFLRDKDKNEVDFLVSKNGQPWMMVEVKASSNGRVSPALLHFQKQLNVDHVFQVVFNMPYEEIDCFSIRRPVIVSARTFLSQLV